MRVVTFKSSQDSFIAALQEGGVQYSRIMQLSTAPMAARTALEIFQTVGAAVPWAAFAAVAIKWIQARHGREIQITKTDGTVFHGKNLTQQEFLDILTEASFAVVIDTNKESQT